MQNIFNIKKDFPIFRNNPDLVYLDSASTSQKPMAVINAVKNFYEKNNANIHRGIYTLSQTATELYEDSRIKVGDFIGAKNKNEIVFTKNTNESINLVANGWAKKFLKKGDVVVLSEMEHHANIIPWLQLKKEIGIKIVYLPINNDYSLDYKIIASPSAWQVIPLSGRAHPESPGATRDAGQASMTKKIKLVAITQASNVLGTVNPVKEIFEYFKKINPEVKCLVDAAQSAPHLRIDVKKLGCDFLAFSSHKMLGPSGVGILWAKEEILEQMDPLLFGSNMIGSVTKDNAAWAEIPDKFEAGTANIEGAIGLGVAIDYLKSKGTENIKNYEEDLTVYALERFLKCPNITLLGPKTLENRIGVFSFSIDNIHAHDTAEILNRKNIAVRSGHHCAMPLMQILKTPATARASIYFYNTREDIDKLFKGIEEVKKVFYD